MFCKYAANLQENSHAKVQSNFIEIALGHGCSLINLLHIFRIFFPKTTSGRLLLDFLTCYCSSCLHHSLFLVPCVTLKILKSRLHTPICASSFKVSAASANQDCYHYFIRAATVNLGRGSKNQDYGRQIKVSAASIHSQF